MCVCSPPSSYLYSRCDGWSCRNQLWPGGNAADGNYRLNTLASESIRLGHRWHRGAATLALDYQLPNFIREKSICSYCLNHTCIKCLFFKKLNLKIADPGAKQPWNVFSEIFPWMPSLHLQMVPLSLHLLLTWDFPVLSMHPYLLHWSLGRARTLALGLFGLDAQDFQGWALFRLPWLYFRLCSLQRPGPAWETAVASSPTLSFPYPPQFSMCIS